ncbi:hypothetical protein LPJ66_002199 [Kickxella alabastrina]|uniref:Uncharacterized protein n=1 Tax=Kickxella alabastrina TaxID=61397 RepID=A0ACC1IR69_9FUNG|nr:hypothetical protein LPJ66_002199 [Kickxella alabastrina]
MAEKFQAKAHHAYSKAKSDELDLSPGDIVHVTNDEHASWWVGQNQMTKEQGWFPSNFVTRLARPEGSSKPKLKTKRIVRIVKAYTAMDEDDLDLQVGDQVEVQKEVDGWFLGTLDSRSGMFPVGHAEVSERRPLPPTPVMCASRRGTFSGGSAPEVGLPVPPALPARTPSLPPRASTETSRPVERRFSVLSAAPVAEAADDGKKEKKSGHRISRLFGAKKSKSKEKEAASDLGSGIGSGEAASRRSFSSATDEPYHFDKQPVYDEQSEEEMISPALPSRPLPQPIAASSLGSPPPSAARPLPSIPQAGLTKLPELPSVAMPPPPATAPVPAPVLAAVTPERRASIASIKSQSSGVSAQYPPSQAPPVPELSAADKETTAGDEPATEPDTESIAEHTDAEEVAKVRGSAKLAKIIEDYEAQSSEELNLMSGDVITIIHRGTDEEPRWKGEYHGKKGYFPGTVVEAIEESADLDEEDDAVNRPRGGFKLAAYGVQQGGLGSIFAGGGGMPALRKSAPTRKSAEQEDQDNSTVAAAPMAMAPAMAPVIPKLRSVKRPQAEEQEPEQQPNFLAQLSRVPRKQVSSEDSAISAGSAPLAVAPVIPTIPAIPVSRKSTAASSIHELEPEPEPEPQAVHKDKTSNVEEEEEEEKVINETSKAESIKEANFYDRDLNETIEPAEPEAAADTTEPQYSDDNNESKDAADEVDASTSAHPSETAEEPSEDAQLSDDAPSSRASSLDPMKSPALSQVKRLVRRGPRQKPTAEGLKKSSEESQSQSLVSALQKDAVLPEPEPEVEKAAPPALPEKPKGLARSAFGGGMQLPTGGFKATGRVGSAMASRLAALQARASGNSAEDEDEDTSASRRTLSGSRPPPTDSHVSAAIGAAPVPVAKKPSFTVRSAATKDAASSAQPPVVSAEWKKQVEDEHSRLRSEIDKASRGTEQQIARLEAKLASSEQENQAHKQNISGLERQVEGLLGQLTGVKSELSGIQKSVAEVGAHRGVTKDEVAVILRAELASALAPIKKQNGELVEENRKLHAKIAELRAYVDELVVEEEEQ